VGIEPNEKPTLATALKRRGLYTSNDEFQGRTLYYLDTTTSTRFKFGMIGTDVA